MSVSPYEPSSDWFERVFRVSLDLICVAGVDGRFKEVNPRFEEVLGYTTAELLERPFLEFLHPDDVEPTVAAVAEVERGRQVIDFVNRYRHKDGSYRWLQWRSTAADESGLMVAIGRDVTESRRQAELMEQTQRAARIGAWELDFTTGELFWTDETYRLHETTPEEFTPTLESAIAFYDAASVPVIRRAVERARDHGEPYDEELGLVTAKGRQLRVRAIGEIRRDAAGVQKVFGSFQDITERKRLEEQLLHSQKQEAIGRLAGGVAHDFNNLLTVILGNVELAQIELPHDSPVQQTMEAVRHAGEKAANLTSQLLAFARKQVVEPVVLDPNASVRELQGLLTRLLGEDIEIAIDLTADVYPVRIDPGQFEQVLINLCVNARDAMPHGGTLSITTRNEELGPMAAAEHPDAEPGQFAVIVVRDTGEGMDESIQSQVFEPFFTTKAGSSGTGLGLATCHGIVRQNGGHIRLASAPGDGSTFEILLPRASEAPATGPVARAVAEDRGDETILLVEDDEAVRRLAAKALERYGYRVLRAANGMDAVRLAADADAPIHLLLTDLVMPRMSGQQTAEEVRERRPGTRVLYASGYAHDVLGSESLAPGDDFLKKPYTPRQLVRAVRRTLDAGATDMGGPAAAP